MRKCFIAGLLFSATAVTGCGSPDIAQHEPTTVSAESNKSDEDIAAETVNRMLKVAKKGNWKAYVDDYYGDLDRQTQPGMFDHRCQTPPQ